MISSPDLARHVGRYYGKYSGIVTDVEDDLKQGRVEVKVPGMFGEEMKVWARPCLPFGHFFIPDVGAHVWIEFEAGDPQHPIWVGVWYPAGTVPPEADISPPENRVIKTPSGHTIQIMDKAGEEKIVVKHKSNSFVSVDDKGSVLISNQKGSHLFLNSDQEEATLMEQHGNLITMTSDGILIVNKSGTTIEMKDGKVRVIAADTVQVSAKDVVLASSTVALGSGATEPAVLGQTFALMYNTHMHPTALGPSGPPVPAPGPLSPAPGMGLSMAVKVK
jgi:hypothetical protein